MDDNLVEPTIGQQELFAYPHQVLRRLSIERNARAHAGMHEHIVTHDMEVSEFAKKFQMFWWAFGGKVVTRSAKASSSSKRGGFTP